MTRLHLAVGVLLAVFLTLHGLYNSLIPLGEGPDEAGHMGYVFFLAREGRLPEQRASPAESDVPGESHQPPLAYLLALPAALWLPEEQRRAVLTTNRDFIWAGGAEHAAFERGSQEYWPWQGHVRAWHLARLTSGLCGAATVLFTYLAARALLREGGAGARGHRGTGIIETQRAASLQPPPLVPLSPPPLDPSAPLPLLAAALVALNPQFLFTTALVTNDALLAALATAILWLCLGASDQIRLGPAVARFLLLGLLFGLALITKQSALLLGPLLLWAGWRAGGALGRTVGLTLAWGITALLVSGWWFLRNLQLYGDIFGLAAFTSEFAGQPFSWGDPAAWRGGLSQLFGSFWGRFGWMTIHAPPWALWIYAALCGLALAGWLLRRTGGQGDAPERMAYAPSPPVSERSERPRPLVRTLTSPSAGLLILGAMACAWLLAFVHAAGLVAWQGRLLFPAIGAIALLLAGGLAQVAGKRQKASGPGNPSVASDAQAQRAAPLHTLRGGPHRLAGPLLMLALLALAAFMPIGVIAPSYRWEVLPPAQAQARLGAPTFIRFAQDWERGVVLRGWRLEGPARPGADLPVTLTWNSLEHVPRSWTVLVEILGPDGLAVAQSISRPRGGAFPFTHWTPGDWVEDRHLIAIPADLPPGDYRLQLFLYRPEKENQRQRAWAENGDRLNDDVGILDKLRIAP